MSHVTLDSNSGFKGRDSGHSITRSTFSLSFDRGLIINSVFVSPIETRGDSSIRIGTRRFPIFLVLLLKSDFLEDLALIRFQILTYISIILHQSSILHLLFKSMHIVLFRRFHRLEERLEFLRLESGHSQIAFHLQVR